MEDMLGRGRALRVEEAMSLLEQHFSPMSPLIEKADLDGIRGRVLGHHVTASEDLPGFDRSTMDGYAVRAADTFGAGESSSAYITVIGEISMGAEPKMQLGPGEAVRIATGGMLPAGADAVLMLEYAQEVDERMIDVQRAVSPGENVIKRGEDVKQGEVVLPVGHRVRPQDVAVLAALGMSTVKVYQRPRVAVISTGDEIVPPEAEIRPGSVRDSNSYHLAALLEEAGAVALRRGICSDDFALIRDEVRRSAGECAMVLISGGSSVGARDVSERVLADLGRVLFHSVAMKPGKPLLAGLVQRVPVFGLPGHPRAVAACFEVFVRPILRRLCGEAVDQLAPPERVVWARITRSVHSSPGRRELITVMLETGDEGLRAVPLLGKSGLVSTMVHAHGTVSISLERVGIEQGEKVEVHLF